MWIFLNKPPMQDERVKKETERCFEQRYLEVLKCFIFYWEAMAIPTGEIAESNT